VTPEFLRIRRHRAVWISTLLGTVAIILWFAFTTDLSAFIGVFEQAGFRAISIVILCIMANAILVVSWLMLIAGRQASLSGASRVVAWHMLVSTILPARLGDLAWMYFMHRWLNFRGSQAVFVALYHRLQDFIAVSGFFVLAVVALGAQALGANVGLAVGALFVVLIGVILWLDRLLTLAALILQRLDRAFGVTVTRLAYRHLLQIRMWYRHSLNPSILWGSFAIIVLRWTVLFLGITVLIHGAAPELDWFDSLFASIAYVLMAIVPLQSFGGFGVGEAGLAWLLTFYGVTLATASAIGLVIRLLTNIVHVVLFLVIMLALSLSRMRTAAITHS
jgi:uncharacterized membrane protein YbhN (UPF0104 family)